MADRSLMMSVVYLVGLLGGCSLLVYAAYIQGHEKTIELVDDAREKVRQILERREARRSTPLSSQGAYQSL